VKAAVSLLLLAREYHKAARSKKEDASHTSWSEAVFTPLMTAVSTRWSDLAVLLIPSILYAGQNNLLVSCKHSCACFIEIENKTYRPVLTPFHFPVCRYQQSSSNHLSSDLPVKDPHYCVILGYLLSETIFFPKMVFTVSTYCRGCDSPVTKRRSDFGKNYP